MRIGVDARLYNQSGIGRYIRNLLTHIGGIDKKNEYFIFLLRTDIDEADLPYSQFKVVPVDYRWYTMAEQLKFPCLLKKYNLDLVHFPHFNVPYFYSGRFIVTIHDLIHQHFASRYSSHHHPLVSWIKRVGYYQVFRRAVRDSEKILTVSQYVRRQLEVEWGVDESKVVVTYEGIEEKLLDLARNMDRREVKKQLTQLGINFPYLFYVGNAHPHKNITGLIEVFAIIKSEYPQLRLVLAGRDNFFWQRIKSKIGLDKDIIFLGFVNDQQLVALYKGAEAYIQPSYEEGFGLPLVEAFACQCLVISSNKGSLPEIGGEACLYFDPYDKKDMIAKIKIGLEDKKLKEELVSKGEKRIELFSWERLAKQTLKVYQSISSV